MQVYSFSQQSATLTLYGLGEHFKAVDTNTLIRACRYKNQPLIIYYLEIMCFSSSTLMYSASCGDCAKYFTNDIGEGNVRIWTNNHIYLAKHLLKPYLYTIRKTASNLQ